MGLPEAIRAYFEADGQEDADRLTAAFRPDAVVRDEGSEHRGSAAIRGWWLAAKAKYRHVAEPVEATVAPDGRVAVRARVSGAFPGSPATLSFVFGLDGERIAGLEIS